MTNQPAVYDILRVLVSPKPDELTQITAQHANGAIKVFEDFRGPLPGVRRIEVTLPQGKVTIHRNVGLGAGLFFTHLFIQKIVIEHADGAKVNCHVQPNDDGTLTFFDDDIFSKKLSPIGKGMGLTLDLLIAAKLLDLEPEGIVGNQSSQIDDAVVAWIKNWLEHGWKAENKYKVALEKIRSVIRIPFDWITGWIADEWRDIEDCWQRRDYVFLTIFIGLKAGTVIGISFLCLLLFLMSF